MLNLLTKAQKTPGLSEGFVSEDDVRLMENDIFRIPPTPSLLSSSGEATDLLED